MFKEVIESIEGISIYPLISLLIFFVFFALIIIWFFKADKKHLKKMKNLPLDEIEKSNTKSTGNNNDEN